MKTDKQSLEKKRILLISQDSNLSATLNQSLKSEEYQIQWITENEKVKESFDSNRPYKLLIKDLELDQSNQTLEQTIKISEHYGMPVLFLVPESTQHIEYKDEDSIYTHFVQKNSPAFILQSSMEITLKGYDNKLIAEQKDLLSRKVQHRIKNNMATIISLLNIQQNYEKNPHSRSTLEKVNNRLLAMEILYIQLHKTKNYKKVGLADYFSPLCDELRSSIDCPHYVHIEQKYEALQISIQNAFPLGLIYVELFSNALYHAFNSEEYGQLHITLKKKGPGIVFTITDNGRGFGEYVPDDERQGFGISLVELLVKQLEGTLEITSEKGTRITIDIPQI